MSPAARRRIPSARWLRHEFPVHKIKTVGFVSPNWLCVIQQNGSATQGVLSKNLPVVPGAFGLRGFELLPARQPCKTNPARGRTFLKSPGSWARKDRPNEYNNGPHFRGRARNQRLSSPPE